VKGCRTFEGKAFQAVIGGQYLGVGRLHVYAGRHVSEYCEVVCGVAGNIGV